MSATLLQSRAACTTKLGRLASEKRLPVSTKTSIRVFDVDEPSPQTTQTPTLTITATQHLCQSSDEFGQRIRQNTTTKLRIVSFHSLSTVTRLQACVEDLTNLFETYDINPLFIDSITSLGSSPHPESGGSASAVVLRHGLEGSFECWYRLQYVEKHLRPRKWPWSERQTAVYHKHDATTKSDLILLFHPMAKSVFETRLIQDTDGILTAIAHSPLQCHALLCESYLDNWQLYLKQYSDDIEGQSDKIVESKFEDKIAKSELSMIDLLHRYRSQCARGEVLVKGDAAILKKLSELASSAQSDDSLMHFLTIAAERSADHAVGFSILQDRVKAAINQFEYTVSYRDQRITADLAQTTADDARQMKTITVLGMIFLPGSFIASLFGMNFFAFNDDHWGLVVGHNWWIFLAFWIPSTLIVFSSVMAYGKVMDRKRKRNLARDEELADGGDENATCTKADPWIVRIAKKLKKSTSTGNQQNCIPMHTVKSTGP